MIEKIYYYGVTLEPLTDKINEIIDHINKHNCKCMNYPSDFHNKHDKCEMDKYEKIYYQEKSNGELLNYCKYFPCSGKKIGSASCSECKFFINNNYIEQFVTCSYKQANKT